MMYARTMSWISRKVSPTFLFLTSTILGVSYSKRKEDNFSMHFCPMAAPGPCRSLLPAPLLATLWVGPCLTLLLQLLCLQRGEKKKRKNNKKAISVALYASGLLGFLLCAGTGFLLPISSGLEAAGALHGPGVGRGAGGCRATLLLSPRAPGTEPPARGGCTLAGAGALPGAAGRAGGEQGSQGIPGDNIGMGR